MSIVLELREHLSHAGIPLVHQGSEDVLLSNVFGVVKNLPAKHVLVPWLGAVTGLSVADARWAFSFWEAQPRPIGIREGSTIVDLVLESDVALVFVEVKLDAPASAGTADDPDRNQLVRNLDIGYRRRLLHNQDLVLAVCMGGSLSLCSGQGRGGDKKRGAPYIRPHDPHCLRRSPARRACGVGPPAWTCDPPTDQKRGCANYGEFRQITSPFGRSKLRESHEETER